MDRPSALPCALFLLTGFGLAGLLHSAWLRSPYYRRWRVPIDGRQTLRGRRLLGDNKTWGGFASMVVAVAGTFTVLALVRPVLPAAWAAGWWPLAPLSCALLGAWAGLGFMAGELPNSFCKRQLDIAPGAAPRHPLGRPLCFVVDRLDSIAGALVALAVAVPLAPETGLYVLLLGPGLHWSFSLLLFVLGVKDRPA
jgi:CDP-2,3-bis-(O-geranylgeranyl)-sn-glycerol synthase